MSPIRVLHPITRLIVGGAQENTMLTAERLNYDPAYAGRYEVDVVCGPDLGPEGSLMDEVRQRRVPLTVIPELRRKISPDADFRSLTKLTEMIRDRNYDIVHTHSSKAGVIGRLAARRCGLKHIVHTVHGWSFHDHMSLAKRILFVSLEKWVASFTEAMIVVTDRDIEKGLAHGIGAPGQYEIIRSGIELDRFGGPNLDRAEQRRRLGIQPGDIVVGSVTRLSPQKAPLDLLGAFSHVWARFPATRFVLVGDGPLRAQVEAMIGAAGLANNVILTGLRRDIPELMSAFDVFVLSSLWEGLPRVLPQAMATGLPVVCTATDGSAEAISDGENGYVVPQRDTVGMADAICRLLVDPVQRRQMGDNGRKRAGIFGADLMVANIDRLYQRLIS